MIVQGETVNAADVKGGWKEIVYALEPLTDTMPDPYRSYFRSPVQMLIGKDISLAHIHPRQMYSFVLDANLILKFIYHRRYLNTRFILKYVAAYLNRLGLSMSEDGLFMKYGPMGFQSQHVTQKLISADMPKRTGGFEGE